jgi:glucosyl-3-phosphoglycerate phosphatase
VFVSVGLVHLKMPKIFLLRHGQSYHNRHIHQVVDTHKVFRKSGFLINLVV